MLFVRPIRQHLRLDIYDLRLENAVPPYLQAGFRMQTLGCSLGKQMNVEGRLCEDIPEI